MGKVVELFNCLKLRCSNCEKEKYEIHIDVRNMDQLQLINYLKKKWMSI